MSLPIAPKLTRRAVCAALVALPLRATAEAPRWPMPTEYPASSMAGEGLKFFAESIASSADGRLAIEPSYDGTAKLRSADMLAAIRAGRIPAADAFAGGLGNVDPVFLVSSLPFLATSVEDASRLYKAALPAYIAALAAANAQLLYATPWPPTGIWAKKPVTRPEDLHGLAIRAYDATGAAVLRSLGATAVELSFADTMPRLRDGSIQAVLSSGDGGAGRKLWEFLPHFTAVTYAVPISLTVVSRDAMNALSGDMFVFVTIAAAGTEMHQWIAVQDRLSQNYAQMRSNGVMITETISPELRAALTDAGAAAVEAWAKQTGSAGAAILERYRRS